MENDHYFWMGSVSSHTGVMKRGRRKKGKKNCVIKGWGSREERNEEGRKKKAKEKGKQNNHLLFLKFHLHISEVLAIDNRNTVLTHRNKLKDSRTK